MLENITPSERVWHSEFQRFYEWDDTPGAGFGFQCDEHGNVDESALNPAANENWQKCLAGDGITDRGVQNMGHWYTEPAHAKCHCGVEIYFHTNSNQCTCGRWFNMSGQELNDPSQWGEETGECAADILRGYHPDLDDY